MSLTLRPYQSAAIDAIYNYFNDEAGNPLIVIPTAGGKALVMSSFIEGVLKVYPMHAIRAPIRRSRWRRSLRRLSNLDLQIRFFAEPTVSLLLVIADGQPLRSWGWNSSRWSSSIT